MTDALDAILLQLRRFANLRFFPGGLIAAREKGTDLMLRRASRADHYVFAKEDRRFDCAGGRCGRDFRIAGEPDALVYQHAALVGAWNGAAGSFKHGFERECAGGTGADAFCGASVGVGDSVSGPARDAGGAADREYAGGFFSDWGLVSADLLVRSLEGCGGQYAGGV